jgi:hypothetical protein
MKQSTRIAGLLVLAAVGSAYAQGRSSEPKSDLTPIVEAVGCLSNAGADWILENATDFAVATTAFTTPEAVKAAADKPLGTQKYRLLGAGPFGPDQHRGHKMVVRGLLIKTDSETRINVTSFQMLAETCAK